MRTVQLSIIALTCLAIPAGAVCAEPIAYPDLDLSPPPPPDPDHQLQPEAAVGFLAGTSSVGPIAGSTFGFHADVGARWSRFALLAEYDFLSLSESTSVRTPVRGFIHRLGATFRYSFGVLTKRDVRGDFWVEAGVGRELIQWNDGGRLHRNDLSFGLAGQATFRFGADKRKKLGVYYAAKFLIANRPDAKMLPPGCAGPCDEASGIIPYDLGIFFNLGVPFGR